MKKIKIFKNKTFLSLMLISVFTAVSFVVLSSDLLAQTSKDDILKQFQQDKDKIDKTDEELKTTMKNMTEELKKKNAKFKVELNEMMKHKISEITGLKPPHENELKKIEEERRKREELERQRKEKEEQKELKRLEEENKKREAELKKREEARKKREEAINQEKDKKKQEEMKKQEEELRKQEEELKKKEDELRKQEEQKKNEQAKKEQMLDRNIPSSLAPSAALSAFAWNGNKTSTVVQSQGTCGSCWAFTSAAVYETNYLIKNEKVVRISEQSILDCAVDRSGKKAGSCDGGWYGGVFDYIMAKGAQTADKFPYLGKDGKCTDNSKTKYTAVKWGYVRPDAGIPSVKEMKEAIA
ncbi:MAG: hypothetical protein FWG49_02685, partial [Leptospirales bacterium]|nr:hypothetical protein [Leptospirales bacterium]